MVSLLYFLCVPSETFYGFATTLLTCTIWKALGLEIIAD